MEEKLLELFKLADYLNEKQDTLFAEIEYSANDRKKLIISIRSKDDYKYIEKCEMELANNPLLNLNNIVSLFKSYIGGVLNE